MFKVTKRYWIFLILLVSISYGQLLQMFPWQDDHALMFKLGNIIEKAGYLGRGIFGEGPYKYTAAFYYPIFKFFGYSIPLFFLLSFVLYLFATFSVYYVVSNVFEKKLGRLAGFLFGAGYIASDGFIRLYNSVGTSLSIIFILFLIFVYWNYYKRKQFKFYLFALFLFFLATEFIRYRTHYLISVVLVFELLFLTFTKPIFKSIKNSLIRLIPFAFIFYRYFIVAGDSRSGKVLEFIQALLRGEFYQTYSFFTSLANLVAPDWLLNPIINMIPDRLINFVTSGVFANSVLNLQPRSRLIPLIGVFIFALLIYLIFKLKKNRRWYVLFVFWLAVNIASYAAYLPTNAYESTNRLLAHSFVALIGAFVILVRSNKYLYYLIIIWGAGNLFNSFNLQKRIILNRSNPAKTFYSELKKIVPELKKGDVLYFDVAESERQKFADSFSVAQMPEETAIAWQYGIDRYDIRRVTEFSDFKKIIDSGVITDINKKELKINNIYTFFYSGDGLQETTSEFRSNFVKKNSLNEKLRFEKIEFTTKDIKNGLEIEFDEPIKSMVPTNLQIEIKALPQNLSKINFPIINNQNMSKNPVAKNERLRKLAFDYQNTKELMTKNFKVKTSSIWKDDIGQNLFDDRKDTYWRADRVLWSKEGAFFTLDLGSIQLIDRFIWINGYSNNSPTKYTIQTSVDNVNWKTVIEKSSTKRIEPNVLNVDKFDSLSARYVRMNIQNTLSNDSASIAGVWVVPTTFAELDILKAEEFLESPFGYVPNTESYLNSLSALNYFGNIQFYWLNNKTNNFQTQSNSVIKVKYDNLYRLYDIMIPAGGTKIFNLNLNQLQMDGVLQIDKIYLKSK
ncbi:MAG: hypothetical protein ACD_26C00034G0036 [uncultured bacterium]|nr:MAG: hypothetical protein ACD_26C00034G0036 [uncultured bacterium]